jgi:hypothetical protein
MLIGLLFLVAVVMVVAAFFNTIYQYFTHVLWFSREKRRFAKGRVAKLAKGLCPSCGYDLTGNTSGTCPECGEKLPLPYRLPPPPR